MRAAARPRSAKRSMRSCHNRTFRVSRCRPICLRGRDIEHRRIPCPFGYWRLCEAFHRPVVPKASLLHIDRLST